MNQIQKIQKKKEINLIFWYNKYNKKLLNNSKML